MYFRIEGLKSLLGPECGTDVRAWWRCGWRAPPTTCQGIGICVTVVSRYDSRHFFITTCQAKSVSGKPQERETRLGEWGRCTRSSVPTWATYFGITGNFHITWATPKTDVLCIFRKVNVYSSAVIVWWWCAQTFFFSYIFLRSTWVCVQSIGWSPYTRDLTKPQEACTCTLP